jgi:homoserine dehydrogenase
MYINVALLGLGNVGRALAELLMQKQEALRKELNLIVRVVGISTGRHGQAIDSSGISLRTALDAVRYGSTLDGLHRGNALTNQMDFLRDVPADVVFETTPTNPDDGQPALNYTRLLLTRGVHVVSANKGPVVHAYRELTEMAIAHDVGYFFESSVMDGAPIFSTAREGLPTAEIKKVRGIFNSTTNYILTRMETDGLSFEMALHEAQKIGIAETDPTLDVEGWDAAIKTAILANVLMGASMKPSDVDRQGIREVTSEQIEEARAAGQRIKLLCEAVREDDGSVSASVLPTRIALTDQLAGVSGTSSVIDLYTDVLPRLTIVENDPGPVTTAYGMLVDMINIVRRRYPVLNEDEAELEA